MAQASGTFDTYDAVGNREELANMIYMITPEDTPFMTAIGRESCKTTHPEWQTDNLATPAANAVHEGNEWTFSDPAATTRPGNYTQISEKKVQVSRTQDKTDSAGRKSELAYQVAKLGVELKKDMEFNLLQNNASVAGASGTPRELGGFPAWLETNADRGATGANGGYNTGTGIVDAATNGTLRAFTKTLMDDVMESTYSEGGNPSQVQLSPYNKRVFSGFSGISELRSDVKGKDQATVYAGADMYISDFGPLAIVPNRVMRTNAATARQVYLVEPDKASVKIFDDIRVNKVAKTSDGEKRVLNVEYSLCVKNEAAHGVVADVFGLTAST